MNNRNIVLIAVAVLAILTALWFAKRRQDFMARSNPPQTVCADQGDALNKAGAYATEHRWEHSQSLIAILGTGSMAPYIPAAKPGQDPLNTVVAYVVVDPALQFSDIRKGDLCSYKADWYPKCGVVHQAYLKDSNGWVMSGLNNREAEGGWRVTERNFLGIVVQTFIWRQDTP